VIGVSASDNDDSKSSSPAAGTPVVKARSATIAPRGGVGSYKNTKVIKQSLLGVGDNPPPYPRGKEGRKVLPSVSATSAQSTKLKRAVLAKPLDDK
jgi:hypothetical protein